jgi:hypothetical protein
MALSKRERDIVSKNRVQKREAVRAGQVKSPGLRELKYQRDRAIHWALHQGVTLDQDMMKTIALRIRELTS